MTVANGVRTHVPVEPVSQVVLELRGGDAKQALKSARDEVLNWGEKKAGLKLPGAAWEGLSFQVEDPGAQYAASVALNDPEYWAARLDDADKNVPGRSWTVEIGLAPRSDDSVVLGVRLYCISRAAWVPFAPSVPQFVRKIAERIPAYIDGRRLTMEPWLVSGADEVRQLVSLILDQRRRRPALWVSTVLYLGRRWPAGHRWLVTFSPSQPIDLNV